MKLYATIVCGIMTLGLTVACNDKKNSSDETYNIEKQTQTKVDSLQQMNEYHYSDRVTWNGKEVTYQVDRHAVDSLTKVVDEAGVRYVDNMLTLTVSHEGRMIFNKTFYKSSFKNFLEHDFYEHSILEGMAFDRVKDGKLCFSVSISYPMSDLYIPLLISVDPNGHYDVTKDLILDNVVETLDTAESES